MEDRPTTQIVCPNCARTNRVPMNKPSDEARCGNCHQPLFVRRALPVSEQVFDKHLRNDGIPIVVDFWASWCGPCKVMSPVFEKVAAELEPDVRFLKVDTEAEQRLAARYSIRSIPMVMMFRDGKVIAQRAGAVNAETLRSWIAENSA